MAVSLGQTNDDGALASTQDKNVLRRPEMEIVAILLLTMMMVGIGWAANDRGEVRSVGSEESSRHVDL